MDTNYHNKVLIANIAKIKTLQLSLLLKYTARRNIWISVPFQFNNISSAEDVTVIL